MSVYVRMRVFAIRHIVLYCTSGVSHSFVFSFFGISFFALRKQCNNNTTTTTERDERN